MHLRARALVLSLMLFGGACDCGGDKSKRLVDGSAAHNGGGVGGSKEGGSGGSVAGSGGTSGTPSDGGDMRDAASDGGGQGGVTPLPYDLNFTQRKGCTFIAGDTTVKTIGPDVPHGDALPFEHIIVLMMENRSFDEYFSNLPAYGVTDVDVATDADFNYDPDTNPPEKIYRFHDQRYCVVDTNHEWSGVHHQYNGGAMDGFVATNNPGGARAMGYLTEVDIPYYYWMAKTFSISDRHFSSLLGPTWPNRFYFYGASSWGNVKTGDVGTLVNGEHQNALKITDLLEQAGRSWKIYRDGVTSFAVVFSQSGAYYGSPIADFDSDVLNDALPNLVVIDPNFSGDGQNDEHPPANIQLGQQFTARILNTLMQNQKVWEKSVFFLLYDEHGGFYDHVVPPAACEPDNFVPPDYRFDRLGIRTPLIVASPYVRGGYVSHFDTDITSVTRFIENRFDLPALTARDANAWPMLDMFDFDNATFATPPGFAPSATPNAAGLAACANNPPATGKP